MFPEWPTGKHGRFAGIASVTGWLAVVPAWADDSAAGAVDSLNPEVWLELALNLGLIAVLLGLVLVASIVSVRGRDDSKVGYWQIRRRKLEPLFSYDEPDLRHPSRSHDSRWQRVLRWAKTRQSQRKTG